MRRVRPKTAPHSPGPSCPISGPPGPQRCGTESSPSEPSQHPLHGHSAASNTSKGMHKEVHHNTFLCEIIKIISQPRGLSRPHKRWTFSNTNPPAVMKKDHGEEENSQKEPPCDDFHIQAARLCTFSVVSACLSGRTYIYTLILEGGADGMVVPV